MFDTICVRLHLHAEITHSLVSATPRSPYTPSFSRSGRSKWNVKWDGPLPDAHLSYGENKKVKQELKSFEFSSHWRLWNAARETRTSFRTKGNCGSPPASSPGICLIFTMETNTVLTCMHTDRAIAMASGAVATRSFQATRAVLLMQLELDSPGQSLLSVHHLNNSFPLLCSQFTPSVITWLPAPSRAPLEGRSCRCWQEKVIPGDASEMQAEPARHASTATISTSSSSSRSGGEGSVRKKKRGESKRVGAALAALHHRLLLSKGGRGVDGEKGGAALPVSASAHTQNVIFMTWWGVRRSESDRKQFNRLLLIVYITGLCCQNGWCTLLCDIFSLWGKDWVCVSVLRFDCVTSACSPVLTKHADMFNLWERSSGIPSGRKGSTVGAVIIVNSPVTADLSEDAARV